MMDRAGWKRFRRRAVGMPPGAQHRCGCGGLVVVEQNEREIVVHHSEPSCAAYSEVVGRAEFLTLHLTSRQEVDEALGRLESRAPAAPPGSEGS